MALFRSIPVLSTSLNSPGEIGSLSPTSLTPLALKPPGRLANCPASIRERMAVVAVMVRLPRK